MLKWLNRDYTNRRGLEEYGNGKADNPPLFSPKK